MKTKQERNMINNWAYFYIFNITNYPNDGKYTINHCAKMAKCSINTISRQIQRIRMGYETDYDAR